MAERARDRLGRGLVDEDVGQHHGTVAQAAVEDAFFGQKLGHVAAEAAHGALFDRDQHFVLTRDGKSRWFCYAGDQAPDDLLPIEQAFHDLVKLAAGN